IVPIVIAGCVRNAVRTIIYDDAIYNVQWVGGRQYRTGSPQPYAQASRGVAGILTDLCACGLSLQGGQNIASGAFGKLFSRDGTDITSQLTAGGTGGSARYHHFIQVRNGR